ncbi:MAG: hypothetical protein ACT4PG_11150 [Panacagrimonas sp.]
MIRDDELQREKFAVAAHLYTRLRRGGGRAIDVMWMTRDDKYAREVLDLARASPDPEVQHYAVRYAELMAGVRTTSKPAAPASMPSSRQSNTAAPAPAAVPEPAPEPAPANRYVRSLR